MGYHRENLVPDHGTDTVECAGRVTVCRNCDKRSALGSMCNDDDTTSTTFCARQLTSGLQRGSRSVGACRTMDTKYDN